LANEKVAQLPIVVEKGVDAVQWLEREVNADFSVAPEVLRISMQGHDTAPLEVIVNAVSEAYEQEVTQIAADSRAGTKAALKQLITTYATRLKAVRDRGRDREVPRDELARQLHREAALEDLREYRRELRKLRLARLAAEAELRRAEEREKEL